VAEVQAPPGGAGAVLAATKLHIPAFRSELVERRALVAALSAGDLRKLTVLEAPAGYGKTTLLAEWCSSPSEEREFAWLSLDEEDGDPVRFWAGAIDALRTLEPDLGAAARSALEVRGADLTGVVLPLVVNELAGLSRRIVLVLDDYHVIRRREVHRSLEFLLDHLPDNVHVAIATRVDPPLSLPRRRARGELNEIRAGRLRFDEGEARELLRRSVEVDLAREDLARLQARTEGWPAGVYLAALSLRGRDDPRQFIESFAGDDRHVVDYLSAEVLAGQPDDVRRFLLRTSILERLCEPLCNRVADTAEAGELLARVESNNLFVIELDTTRTWYRYHRLFAELLRHELELAEPRLVAELHRRARRWFEAEGSVADAVHHAIGGGDVEAARELVAQHWNERFNQGRLATVERWIESIPRPLVAADPRLCVARAWLALDRGRLDEAGEWIDAGEGQLGANPDAAVEADLGVLRAVHGFKEAELSRSEGSARRVLASAEEGSFPETVARLILGIDLYWQGRREEAEATLRAAMASARASDNDLGRSYALGYLALIEVDRGHDPVAERLAGEAIGLSDAPGFVDHFVLMVGHLAEARVAERRGRLDEAERAAARSVALSDRGAGRLELAASRIALARIRHLRGDVEGARDTIAAARRSVAGCQELGTLGKALAAADRELRTHPRSKPTRAAETEELTARELAVLRLLASELTRPEIADALYVSENTVKTHLRAIYRKLDASSREEVVARGRELELIPSR
jgi:LuxR family transcriptional regulator, maltose regulon positive regulatory protein